MSGLLFFFLGGGEHWNNIMAGLLCRVLYELSYIHGDILAHGKGPGLTPGRNSPLVGL